MGNSFSWFNNFIENLKMNNSIQWMCFFSLINQYVEYFMYKCSLIFTMHFKICPNKQISWENPSWLPEIRTNDRKKFVSFQGTYYLHTIYWYVSSKYLIESQSLLQFHCTAMFYMFKTHESYSQVLYDGNQVTSNNIYNKHHLC